MKPQSSGARGRMKLQRSDTMPIALAGAEAVLKEHWDNLLPVKPQAIAEKLGIILEADDALGDADGEYLPSEAGTPPKTKDLSINK